MQLSNSSLLKFQNVIMIHTLIWLKYCQKLYMKMCKKYQNSIEITTDFKRRYDFV